MVRQIATDYADELDEGFRDRFKALLDRFPTMMAAAEVAGYSAEQVAKWRDGKAKIPLRPVAAMCEATATSMDWLAFGRESSAPMSQVMAALPDNVAMIPLLDVVASAGPGIHNARPYEIEQLPFSRSWLRQNGLPEEYARFLELGGDSMEPTIADGAICLVDTRAEQVRRDGIYVLIDGDNVRIKRVAIGWQGAIQLISDNERYQVEQLAPPDAELLRVAGRVVWSGGKV